MLSESEIRKLRTSGNEKLPGFTETGTLYEVCDTCLALWHMQKGLVNLRDTLQTKNIALEQKLCELEAKSRADLKTSEYSRSLALQYSKLLIDENVSFEAMQQWIEKVCDGLKTLLTERQKSYGNTIGEPLRVCSKAGPVERAAVYIDQKINRASKGKQETLQDTEADMIGYLILKRALEYGQGKTFSDPLDMYIRYLETHDKSLLEKADRYAHDGEIAEGRR